jgi:hypothetical protein
MDDEKKKAKTNIEDLNPIQQPTSHSFLEQKKATNIYGGEDHRQVSTRTPLLEHYQNGSGTRNANVFTSVPRPTIASELKILKEMSRGSLPA